jgi:2-polyprenyl-3-methyl-5-hydroxy-6-metoxy-1,4-benzoquinol methylase
MIEKTNPFGQRVFPPLKKHSKELSKLKTALDIGCANGADSRYLASLGLAVDAVDKKLPDGLESCEKITFQQIDIRDFPFDKKYDVIVVRNVLHCFYPEKRDALMVKIYDALNVGGYLFITNFTDKDSMSAPGKFKEYELFDWTASRMRIQQFFDGEETHDNHDDSPGQHSHNAVMVVGKKV